MIGFEVQPPLRCFNRQPRRQRPTLFLAGSIEMGAAEDWQPRAVQALRSHYSLIYNPRRADWDSSWEQRADHPEFNAQVNWELDMIAEADVIGFYFAPQTKSPITLMELGVASQMPAKKLVVCCPDGFWRKGNVDILCNRVGVPVQTDFANWLAMLRGVDFVDVRIVAV